MRAVNKRDSIYIQLLKLLVGSAAAVFLVFLGLNCAGDFVIDQYCYHPVTFADGKAGVGISGMYAYQFYNYALTAELAVCFFLFLAFVILGIRTKIRDILTLSREIEILEGGSLDYEITVKGKDEMGAQAEGLENMRLSFRSMIEREAAIVQENQKAVTEMSHDLRTPVTSILLYTEI